MPMSGTIQPGKPIKPADQSSGVDNRYIQLNSGDIGKYKETIAKAQTLAHEQHSTISLKQREAIAAQAGVPQAGEQIKPVPLMNFDNKIEDKAEVAAPAIEIVADVPHTKLGAFLSTGETKVAFQKADAERQLVGA